MMRKMLLAAALSVTAMTAHADYQCSVTPRDDVIVSPQTVQVKGENGNLVITPDGMSTKFVYTNLRANELTCHPDIDGQIRALQDGDLEAVCKKMGNVLETVTIPAYPIIQTIKDKMMQCGAVNAMMSGSGPTGSAFLTSVSRQKRRPNFCVKKTRSDRCS